jgi:hypothetical protein
MDICQITPTIHPLNWSTNIVRRLATPILVVPYSNNQLPQSVDISSLADGHYLFCVSKTGPSAGEDCVAFTKLGQQQILINDTCNNPPVAKCKNIVINADDSCHGCTTAVMVDDGSYDSDGDTIALELAPPCPYALGDNMVTLTVSDSHGASSSCMATVSVRDSTPPTFSSCPENVIANTAKAQCSASVNYNVTAGDNCPGVTIDCVGNNDATDVSTSGGTFQLGVTEVTCTATDTATPTSYRAMCGFTVTLIDTQNPTVACPADITSDTELGACTVAVDFGVDYFDNWLGAAANCTTNGLAVVSGARFPSGITIVNCTATDSSGNTGRCSFAVTVVDTERPAPSCPADITVSTAPGQCSSNVSYGSSFTDNCPGGSIICDPASGYGFLKGTTNVNCTATDASGHTTNCTFSVTVNDVEPPTITCPTEVVTNTAPAQCSRVVTFSPTATDNCPGVATSCLPPSGSNFAKGTTDVTCTATDESGNSTSCKFTVTVNDIEPPALNDCPAPTLNFQCYSDLPAAAMLTATDNCDSLRPVTFSEIEKHDPGSNCSNTIVRTWIATDFSGNTASCIQTITVNNTMQPVLAGCTNQIVFQQQVVTNAQTCITANLNGTPISAGNWIWFNSVFKPAATNTSYTITIYHQTITGSIGGSNVDLIVPDAEIAFSSTFSSATTGFDGVKWWTTGPLASKLPGNEFMSGLAYQLPFYSSGGGSLIWCATLDVTAGVSLNWKWAAAVYTTFSSDYDTLGIKPVDHKKASAYKNPDKAGTPENFKQFMIGGGRGGNVANMTGQYSGIAVGNIAGTIVCQGGAVQYNQPTADDGCEGLTAVECAPPPGLGFNTGTTNITCATADQCGNISTCSFTLTVQKPLPKIVCPANIVTNTAAGSCSQTVKWTRAAKSACGGTVRTDCIPPSGSNFSKGTTTVICTAAELGGSSASCSFIVTVNDSTKPTITCADIKTNSCSEPVLTFSPTASDNCGATNMRTSCAPPSGSTVPQGTTLVTCTATDDSGNTASRSFKISITATALSPPGELKAMAGTGSVTLSWKSSNGSGPTTYNALRGTKGGSETTYATGITTTSYTDSAVAKGTKYYYVVTATNCKGQSGKSNEISVIPQ